MAENSCQQAVFRSSLGLTIPNIKQTEDLLARFHSKVKDLVDRSHGRVQRSSEKTQDSGGFKL